MPKKQSFITITDQFCGAGGSSQGARKALAKHGIGADGIRLALNHWSLAIETHNTNFPDTLHDCTDISACDPRRYPSTDILITSPECTDHSLAKGQKIVKKQMDLFASGKMDAAAERSRATMWDVVRFAEYHRYNAIIVENVVDARKWVMFDSWLNAMTTLGYNHKCVYLNSMHVHPTPQSRDRMYVVFWKKGNKAPDLDYMPLAFSPKLGKDVNAVQSWKNPLKKFGKYRQQYVYCCPVTGYVVEPYYYAAFNCIDWSDLGTRISERRNPLSEKTMGRIRYGLEKYGRQPFIINDQHSTGINYRVKGVDEIIPTIPTTHQIKLVTQPFIIKLEHSQTESNAIGIGESFRTQTTRQSAMMITPSPFITVSHGTSKAISATSALNGVCAGGIHSGIVSTEAFSSFIHYNYGSTTLSHPSQPLGSTTTKDRASIISYQETAIQDCFYRMLKAPEVKLAMAFERDYVVLGSGKDQVKQLGNAVTPPAMEFLVNRLIESFK